MSLIYRGIQFWRRQRQVDKMKPLQQQLEEYKKFYVTDEGESMEDAVERRKKYYGEIASRFYALTGSFMEVTGGPHFHFYPRRRNESHEFGIRKTEFRYALKLELKPGDEVIDLGCGIGGPARNIAEFSRASITGITITPSQVVIARELTDDANLNSLCKFEQGDMCSTPFADCSFDKAYSLEGTLYVPYPELVFREVFRILKPGGLFLVQGDGVLTDNFDFKNKTHRRVHEDLCSNIGVTQFKTFQQTRDALIEVGFDILEDVDLESENEVPHDDFGIPPIIVELLISVGIKGLSLLEFLRIVPKGTRETCQMMKRYMDISKEGYHYGILSCLLVVVSRKPDKPE